MGMEGKLRQISEFELASYRKTPAKLYSEILAQHESADISQLTSAMSQLKNSPAAQRIQLMKLAGVQPSPDDLDAFFQQQEAVLRENQGALDDLQSNMTGLSKDGISSRCIRTGTSFTIC